MPEGETLHNIAKTLRPALVGRVVNTMPPPRPPLVPTLLLPELAPPPPPLPSRLTVPVASNATMPPHCTVLRDDSLRQQNL